MPIYDFYCENCGRKEELLVSEIAKPLCSFCDWPMKKECSCTRFILKGEGWEKDGYARKREMIQKGSPK